MLIVLILLLLAALGLSLYVNILLVKRIKSLKQTLDDAVQEGLRVSTAAIENDRALRQGLEDQHQVWEAECLDRDDKITDLTTQNQELKKLVDTMENDLVRVDTLRETLAEKAVKDADVFARLRQRIYTLENQHQFHKDHCLPVLKEMREEIGL